MTKICLAWRDQYIYLLYLIENKLDIEIAEIHVKELEFKNIF